MAIEVAPNVETVKKLTPDDVLRMMLAGELNPEYNYELDDGELIEVPPAFGDHGMRSATFVGKFYVLSEKAGGCVFDSSTGFLVGAEFKQLRSPDAAYIGPARAQPSYPRWVLGAPDIAVEVLSRDQYTDRYARAIVREYFEAGAQIVWLADPIKKEIRVYRADSDEYTIYRRDGVLTLEPIVEGFALKVSDIFP
ncbi:MAG: Uma2 family endonuclease [Chloroflexota bacterium]